MTHEFWGLDLETSGTSHHRHVPIQIGLAAPDHSTTGTLLGGWPFGRIGGGGWPAWDDTAAKVHGIPMERLQDAPRPSDIEPYLVQWVEDRTTALGAKRRVLVGWNIAGFDRPFVEQYLPLLNNRFSYRTLDLNAVIFATVEAGLCSPTGIRWTYDALKRRAKAHAEQTIRQHYPEVAALGWHDASYDALAALYSFDALRTTLRGA